MRSGSGLCCVFCLAVVACGCNSGKQPSTSAANAVRLEELVGKWRLIRVGGKDLEKLAIKIKMQEVTIEADGKWTSKIEFQLPGFGVPDVFTANGTLALPDSRLRLESGKLVVEPDFFMPARPKGTPEGPSEYERSK